MNTPGLLVIDDEPAIAALVVNVGQAMGFRAEAINDLEHLRSALEGAPDTIVLDLSMPNFDGVQVLRHLADVGCRAGIILMSGFDRRVLMSTSNLATRLGLSVVGVIEKPFRVEGIREVLRRGLPTLPRPVASAEATLADLRLALRRHELVLHYQPQVDLNTRRWVGVEALVRWRHPERGLLGPECFVGLAERSGLALELTDEVIELALAEFDPAPFGPVGSVALAINLPPVALTDRGFPEQVLRRLAAAGRSVQSVRFEVTETSVAESPDVALDILTRLRLKGFGLALDDYGTGHGSLERLRDFPFDELKIDLQFVRAVDVDPTARAIVASSVALGRELGLRVVAEGIETTAIERIVVAVGAECGQGYHFARPMPWSKMGAWFAGWLGADPEA